MRGDVTNQNRGSGQHCLGLSSTKETMGAKNCWNYATDFSQSLTKKAENAINNVRRLFYWYRWRDAGGISWAPEVVAANEPQSVNSGGGKIIYLK